MKEGVFFAHFLLVCEEDPEIPLLLKLQILFCWKAYSAKKILKPFTLEVTPFVALKSQFCWKDPENSVLFKSCGHNCVLRQDAASDQRTQASSCEHNYLLGTRSSVKSKEAGMTFEAFPTQVGTNTAKHHENPLLSEVRRTLDSRLSNGGIRGSRASMRVLFRSPFYFNVS